MAESVVINGVRYVPVADVTHPSLTMIRDALLALWHIPPFTDKKAREVFVIVTDDFGSGDGPPTVADFIEELAVTLAGAET